MQRFMYRILPTSRFKLGFLIFAILFTPIVLVGGSVVYVGVKVPYYTNKSVDEQHTDEERLANELAIACTEAGHNWDNGECYAIYPQPDTRWYEEPQRNQTHSIFLNFGVVAFVGSIALGFSGALLLIHYVSERKCAEIDSEINDLQQKYAETSEIKT